MENDPEESATPFATAAPPFTEICDPDSVVPVSVTNDEEVGAFEVDTFTIGATLSCVMEMVPVAVCEARSVEVRVNVLRAFGASGTSKLHVPPVELTERFTPLPTIVTFAPTLVVPVRVSVEAFVTFK